ncbi:MAG: DNA-directed RNA polymerase subunit beta, partial [Bacteroidales bacterium]
MKERIKFGKSLQYETPDLLEIQLQSFKDFFQLETTPENRKNEGLFKVFKENFPITDSRGLYVLDFVDYYVDPPRYTIEECMERGLTYSVPFKARLYLYCTDPEHEDFEAVTQDVYLGPIPYMTPKGTFIINGSERVVVSQMHRSPGVFFQTTRHPNGRLIYSARIIPLKGTWIEFTTDIQSVMYAYIDRKKKVPMTTLLRAIGYETDKDILEIFNLTEEVEVNEENLKNCIGRKLAARVVRTWIEDFVDEDTGELTSLERTEVLIERETVIEEIHIPIILKSDTETILLHRDDIVTEDYSVLFNTLQKDPANNQREALEYIYRQLRNTEPPDKETALQIIDKLFFSDKKYDLGEVGRYKINKKLGRDTVDINQRVLTHEDIIDIIKYLINLINNKTDIDDIDHLSNRRVRTVGEQLYMQFGVGLARMARTIRERMNVRDNEVFKPIDLINAKALSSVINTFFGTNQLSQLLDQTNPLSELTHKRRVSALGPGGLSRERAGFEVRDVHYTHYGRLCPIETPEGPNIGLINSLTVYSRINDLGFIETPYRRVVDGVVHINESPIYLTAEDEENYYIAPANTLLDENGLIVEDLLMCRYGADFPVVPREQINLMDVATNQIASVSASLIPFLENDDANRALMGSNMMRQAVPLLNPEVPIIATGLEAKVAESSRVLINAEHDGIVEYVDAKKIVIRYDLGENDKLASFDDDATVYELTKFLRTNQNTIINLIPIVKKGDKVKKGQVLCEGFATKEGELALGRNLLAAFMPWKGYNYEDAIVISERVIKEDLYTSIHIEEFSTEVRETKRG